LGYNLGLKDQKPQSHYSIATIYTLLEKARPKHSMLRLYINRWIFVVAALPIIVKHQYGKNHNKNTGLFINCMDFVVVRTKINKKLYRHFFLLCCFRSDSGPVPKVSKS
jgi:hypothetical protein